MSSDIPPVGTALGDLEIGEVFVNIDGPRLFVCRNRSGQLFLAVFASDADDGASEIYLYVPVSMERFQSVRSGQLSLRTAFSTPQDRVAYAVTRPFDGSEPEVSTLHQQDIPSDWLPAETAVIRLPTATAPAFDLEEMALAATGGLRPFAAFEFEPEDMTTEMGLRDLGALMQLIQDNVEAQAQEEQRRQTAAGPVQQDIATATELAFSHVRAASFVLVVAPRASGQLFASPLTALAMSRLQSLMNAAVDEDVLREAVSQLRSRALSKYRDLLEQVEDSSKGLALHVASPEGEVRSARLGPELVTRTLGVVRATKTQPSEVKTIEGLLIGVNARTRVFELFDEAENRKYAGKTIEEARKKILGLTIGARYRARLLQETEVTAITGELKPKFSMTDIEAIDPQPTGVQ